MSRNLWIPLTLLCFIALAGLRNRGLTKTYPGMGSYVKRPDPSG